MRKFCLSALEKYQGALLLFVPDCDAAQEQIAFTGTGQFVEKDNLVAPNASALGDWAAPQDAVVGIVLHAGDEVNAVSVQGAEPSIIGEAAIEDDSGSGLEAQGTGDTALMHAAFGDQCVAGQQTLMIKQQMQFYSTFGAPVLRPVEDRGAEFDRAASKLSSLFLKRKPWAPATSRQRPSS
jgi:hypothetical protein